MADLLVYELKRGTPEEMFDGFPDQVYSIDKVHVA